MTQLNDLYVQLHIKVLGIVLISRSSKVHITNLCTEIVIKSLKLKKFSKNMWIEDTIKYTSRKIQVKETRIMPRYTTTTKTKENIQPCKNINDCAETRNNQKGNTY